MIRGADTDGGACCAACGCCCVLFAREEDVPFPEGAWGGGVHDVRDAWPLAQGWDERFRECGAYAAAPPAWDLLRGQERSDEGVLTPAAEAYRRSLPEEDFDRCPYLGTGGCVLPRGSRPPVCTGFSCDRLWDALGVVE